MGGVMAKKALVLFLVWLIAAATGGCQYMSGEGHQVRISEAQLQEKLDKRFPRTQSYMGIFGLTLEHPRVHLDNGSGRIGVALDFELSLGLARQRGPFRGSLDFSTGLSYVSDTGSFFLSDPVIENLNVEGLSTRQTKRLRAALGTAIAEHALSHPVYSLKDTDIRQLAARMTLKSVVVDQGALVLTMGL
jgi:hypothetical protein